MILKAQLGDIIKITVDAIVNSDQSSLRRGGGVDGAIHEAAGPELQEECFTIEPPKFRTPEFGELGEVTRCSTGGVQVTKAYRLPAKYVFHTVGPVWRTRHLLGDEDLLLSLCYRHCLETAVELQVK